MNFNPAANVVDVFQGFRMAPTAIDQFETTGKQLMIDKVKRFTDAGDPVEFVMLGFPMKSMNDRDKVLGKLPDLGEELSMANFARFNQAVTDVYRPGAKITLVSDGYVFNDVMDMDDRVVSGYEEVVKDMSKIAPIEWYDLRDFYSSRLTVPQMRNKLEQQFGITELELERRILTDADVNFLYRGMIKFMEGDLAIRNLPSRNQLNKQAKQVAKVMMLRNEAFSGLVREEFGDSVRLSMHPSVNSGAKYSYQLVPGKPEKIWTSPWHSAILIDSQGEVNTVHKKDALQAGHQIINHNGRPYYFQAN